MSTKISELSSLVGGIPATNAVPISVDGTTYKVNLGNLAEETASADVLTAIGAANKAALATAVVDGTAINPSSIGATTPGTGAFTSVSAMGNITSASIVNGAVINTGYTFRFNGVTEIWDEGANIIGQRNGTNAQESRLYATYTSSTVYERLSSKYDSGSGAFVIGTEKGASGGSARPLWLLADAGYAKLDTSGNLTTSGQVKSANGGVILGSSVIYFDSYSKSVIMSLTDGNLRFTNAAETGFGLLQLGGGTSSYPAIKRSGATIQARLADDSADAPIQASRLNLSNLPTSAAGLSAGDIWNDSGTLKIA